MIFLESYIRIAASDSTEDSTEVRLELFEDLRNVLLFLVLALIHHTDEFGLSLQQLLIKSTLFI